MAQTTITPTRYTKHRTHIMPSSYCLFYKCYVIFEPNIYLMIPSIKGQSISPSTHEINSNVLISKIVRVYIQGSSLRVQCTKIQGKGPTILFRIHEHLALRTPTHIAHSNPLYHKREGEALISTHA